MEMTKIKMIVLPAIVLLTLGSLASLAWAGDIKGKVTAQGMRSPENIAVYLDSVPGKTFPPPAPHAVMDQSHLAFVPHVLIVLQQSPFETRAQPLQQARYVLGRRIARNYDLFLMIVQLVEGVKELFLRALLVAQQLDIVDQQHVRLAITLVKLLHALRPDARNHVVHEALARRINDAHGA